MWNVKAIDTDGDVGGYSLGHVTRYSLDSDSARH